jgi:hypothetical protein
MRCGRTMRRVMRGETTDFTGYDVSSGSGFAFPSSDLLAGPLSPVGTCHRDRHVRQRKKSTSGWCSISRSDATAPLLQSGQCVRAVRMRKQLRGGKPPIIEIRFREIDRPRCSHQRRWFERGWCVDSPSNVAPLAADRNQANTALAHPCASNRLGPPVASLP